MGRGDRHVFVLGLLAILAAALGFYLLLLGPLLGRLDERARERDEKEARLANLRQDVEELEAVEENAPELQRQLLGYSKRVPTQPQIETLAVQLEEVATKSGVTWEGLDPGTPYPAPGGGDYWVYPITMSFEGTYEQLQEFLLGTRNLVRLVTVNEVTFEALEPGERTGAIPRVERPLRAEVRAHVYFQPPDPTGVPSGSPRDP